MENFQMFQATIQQQCMTKNNKAKVMMFLKKFIADISNRNIRLNELRVSRKKLATHML